MALKAKVDMSSWEVSLDQGTDQGSLICKVSRFYSKMRHIDKHMPSSQITFKGRPIFSVGQPKQVQPTNTFIKSVNLKLL